MHKNRGNMGHREGRMDLQAMNNYTFAAAPMMVLSVPLLDYNDVTCTSPSERERKLDKEAETISFPLTGIQWAKTTQVEGVSGMLTYAEVKVEGRNNTIMVRKTDELVQMLEGTAWRNIFGVQEKDNAEGEES